MNRADLFSKTALDRLSSPEKMDAMLNFGSRGLWSSLCGTLLLLAAVVVWGFLGRVNTDITGQGILLHSGDVQSIPSLGDGQVQRVLISAGQHIDAGMVVATILEQQPADELAAAQAQVVDLKRQLDEADAVRNGQRTFDETSFQRQRNALEQQRTDLAHDAETLHERQSTERGLLSKGLITRRQMTDTDKAVSDSSAAQAQIAGQIGSLESERNRTLHSGADQRTVLQGQIDAAQHRVEELEHMRTSTADVRSAIDGTVTEVNARPGMLISRGAPIARIEGATHILNAVVFASSQKARQIAAGMEVQISPAGLRREEFGFLRGIVTSVSPYPVSSEEMMERLSNTTLIAAIDAGGPVNEVEVKLLPATQSGVYRWSSPRGETVPLSSGTMLSADIVVRQESPASLIIPYVKRKTGWR